MILGVKQRARDPASIIQASVCSLSEQRRGGEQCEVIVISHGWGEDVRRLGERRCVACRERMEQAVKGAAEAS